MRKPLIMIELWDKGTFRKKEKAMEGEEQQREGASTLKASKKPFGGKGKETPIRRSSSCPSAAENR